MHGVELWPSYIGIFRAFSAILIEVDTKQGLLSGMLAVMIAMALGHVKAGRIEQVRSLVQPIRQTG